MDRGACLTTEEIEAYVNDLLHPSQADGPSLSPELKARIEDHLKGCDKCRRLVEARTADHDLTGELRQAHHNPRPNVDAGASTLPTEGPTDHPHRIGPYRIREQIGEGGMGTVYLAEQTEPVRRRVALKLVKLGMNTQAVVARFESERQALAMMSHPNVAAVYDAGVTERGRPFFAMEYVPGVPITKFCDTFRLTIPERLELFMQVCAAIQHAHQKGIIHRDIKPSNVLVMRQDGKPVPKVIDFGVAKATDQRLTEQTVYTEHGVMIGTPEYMSPEQAEMSQLAVDTRTDVYSLGVLLYELLVGALPFESSELRRAGFAEIQRIIREVEPPKPSTRFSSMQAEPQGHSEPQATTANATGQFEEPRASARADIQMQETTRPRKTARTEVRGSSASSAAAIADQRRLDPKAMRRQLQGDLDWITMKAMDKDPARRYETATGLAADIARHLNSEPVLASPPSVAYRAKKFIRRNRGLVTSAAVVALVLLAGIVGTSWQAVVATHQRNRAVTAERDQSRARQEAVQARADAIVERDKAEIARQAETEQRRIAEAAEREQSCARKEAETARDEAEKQKHQARRQSYLSSIFAADAALQSNEIATARGRLDAAPSEFRNWEWHYLHAALDQSITPVLLEEGVRRHIIAISPDATTAVTQIVDGVHTIWNLDTRRPIAHFQKEAKLAYESPLRFSADGTRIVAILDDNTARIWDTATGKQLLVLRGREGKGDDEFHQFHSVSFRPDMTRIVTTSGDNTAHIWDAATGEQLAVLPKIGPYSWWASFNPDGTRIVIASWNSFAHICDAATGEQLYKLDGGNDFNRYSESHGYGFSAGDDHVQPASFSPDGTRIVTASVFHTARLSDAATGESLTVFRQHDDQVRSASFSPDGKRIVTASGDKTARVWIAATGEELTVLRGHDDAVNAASFNPDGTRVVTASSDRTIRTWDAATGKQLAVYRGHENPVYSVAFTPDGTRIVSASDHAAHIWDATANDQLLVIGTDWIPDGFGYDGIESVSFSPDGARIMTNSSVSSEPARIWDAVTGNQLAFLPGLEGWAGSASLGPDGFRVVTSSGYSDSVSIWNAATGEQRIVLSGQDNIGPTSFSPDGSQIVTALNDKTARIWDATTGKQLVVLKGDENGVNSASFSPDGTRIVSASYDETARVWDAATGKQFFVLRGHEGDIFSASFSPDGTLIVTASSDNTARIWNAASGEQLTVLRGHEKNVKSASFSPAGTRIVTASWDNTARIWDAATGEQLLVLRGHEASIHSASFSPDGTRIVTGHNATIRLWDSVPYAQRYRQKQAYKKAKPKAARLLDIVTATAPQRDGGPDLQAVAKSIRTDSGIDDTVRHVAINLLMHRAQQIRSKSKKVVEDVKNHFVFAADIQASVRTAPSLEPAVRAAAIRIARRIEDSSSDLSSRAGHIAYDDERSPADYEQAQRAAASAFRSDPTSLYFAKRLAKAWVRLHQPDKTMAVWREHVEKLRKDTLADDSGQAETLADTLIEYGKVLLKNDRAEEAEPLLSECLSIREKALKKSNWQIDRVREVLAECLTAQGADPSLTVGARIKKFTEAEAILVEMADAVLEDTTASKDDKTKAIQRVVNFYDAWHAAEPDADLDSTGGTPVPQKAAEWRAKLPAAASQPAASQPATQPSASRPAAL